MKDTFRRYRTRKLIEAKQVDHGFRMHNPRTGHVEQATKGDYLVREGGKATRVIPREVFELEYELVP
jgi:hypothetical protein